ERLGRHSRERALDHPARPRVAVVERDAENAPAVVEERVVHSPRIDPDAVERPGAPQRAERLGEQMQHVPVQPVGQAHRSVSEPVHLAQRQAVTLQAPGEDAPARGAEIDGRVGQKLNLSMLPLSNTVGGPSSTSPPLPIVRVPSEPALNVSPDLPEIWPEASDAAA